MPTRTLTKLGPTITLRPVAPSFAVTESGVARDLGPVTGFIAADSYVFVHKNSSYFNPTNWATGAPSNSGGYFSVARDLKLQGFYTPVGVVGDFSVGTQRFDESTRDNTGWVTVYDTDLFNPTSDFSYTFVDGPVYNSGVRLVAGATRDVRFAPTSAPGWSNIITGTLLGRYRYFCSLESAPNTYAFNELYDTTYLPGRFVGFSVNRIGSVSFFNAFPHSAVNYTLMSDPSSDNFSYTTQVPDGSFWTFVQTLYAVAPPGDYTTASIVNWRKNEAATGYDFEFSDATDQSDYTAFIEGNSVDALEVRLLGNYFVLPLSVIGSSSADYLVVSPDWTTYQRFAIRSGTGTDDRPGEGSFAVQQFYRDRDGFYYGMRANKFIYRLYTNGDPSLGPHGTDITGAYTHSVSIP